MYRNMHDELLHNHDATLFSKEDKVFERVQCEPSPGAKHPEVQNRSSLAAAKREQNLGRAKRSCERAFKSSWYWGRTSDLKVNSLAL
jgi:hypothetical protein